jgi:hypothetical protein
MIQQQPIGAACIAECRKLLRRNYEKIRHCIDQLNDEHVNWRPFAQQNSIANVILHLCGNARQWIISGIGGASDVRHRPSEFSDRATYAREDLLLRLEQTFNEADGVLATIDPAQLLTPKTIQGFQETNLTAMLHASSHFEGHTHEIVYITRFLIREKYKFKFVPQNETQGA